MKNLLLFSCLFLAGTFASISETPKHIEAIDIDMNGDILYANSNNPEDPMKQIRMFNGAGQQVAYKKCSSGLQCSLDVHALPSGLYVAVASSLQGQLSESVFVQ